MNSLFKFLISFLVTKVSGRYLESCKEFIDNNMSLRASNEFQDQVYSPTGIVMRQPFKHNLYPSHSLGRQTMRHKTRLPLTALSKFFGCIRATATRWVAWGRRNCIVWKNPPLRKSLREWVFTTSLQGRIVLPCLSESSLRFWRITVLKRWQKPVMEAVGELFLESRVCTLAHFALEKPNS